MAHAGLIQDHGMWMRDRRREAERGQTQGVGYGSGVLKPSKPVTWAEWAAQGIETPFDYEAKFLPGRGWDDAATGVCLG